MRKLIAFVGTGDYTRVKYKLGKNEGEGRFPFCLTYKIYKPDEVYIISTKKGLNKWFGEIKNLIPEAKAIEISMPTQPNDIWDIHRVMEKILQKDDEVVMDITYSFRHIPFMTFSSILYEFRIKNITVLGIFYGAKEAEEGNVVPLLDLSGAVELIEWHYALSSFMRYGRSRELTDIAEKLKRKEEKDKTRIRDYGALIKITKTIESISDAIYMNQNVKVLNSCKSLQDNIERYHSSFENFARMYPPLRDARQKLREFTDMGYQHPEKSSLNKEILEKLVKVAEYQMNIGLFGESIETLREWLVSFSIFLCGKNLDKWLESSTRRDVERALGALMKELQGELMDECELTDTYHCLKSFDKGKWVNKIVELWGKIINIRNRVAHAGMSKEVSLDPKSSKVSIEEILNDVRSMLEGV